jgi:response regulator RpfG family c-di-GMP phosphodiesterase
VADALGSDRTYRPAWPAKRIQEYLREQSGLQFKPQVVAMFLAMDAV